MKSIHFLQKKIISLQSFLEKIALSIDAIKEIYKTEAPQQTAPKPEIQGVQKIKQEPKNNRLTGTLMGDVVRSMKKIGRPATSSEIAQIAGITASKTNSALQNLLNKKIIGREKKDDSRPFFYYLKVDFEKFALENDEIKENILYVIEQNRGQMKLGDICTFFTKDYTRAAIEANCLAMVREKKLRINGGDNYIINSSAKK